MYVKDTAILAIEARGTVYQCVGACVVVYVRDVYNDGNTMKRLLRYICVSNMYLSVAYVHAEIH